MDEELLDSHCKHQLSLEVGGKLKGADLVDAVLHLEETRLEAVREDLL